MNKEERKRKFEEIKRIYQDFYNKMLKRGQITVWSTEKGIWGPSNIDAVFEFFEKIELQNYSHFLDLGSGDGLVNFIASLFTKSVGIEYDQPLFEKSLEFKERLNEIVGDVSFLCEDYLKHDFAKYDVLFINPDNSFEKLEKKLLQELNGILIVYNDVHRPYFLDFVKMYTFGYIPIRIFKRKD